MAFMPCIINSTAAADRQPVTTPKTDAYKFSAGNFPRKRGPKSSAVNQVLPKRAGPARFAPVHGPDFDGVYDVFWQQSVAIWTTDAPPGAAPARSSGPASGFWDWAAARPWRRRRPAATPATPGRRGPHPVREIHARQWPDRHGPHRPQGADRGGQRLVPRRLEERIARQDGVCPPVRAPDVPGLRALRRRVLQAVRAGRRDQHERHDQLRPHQLFPERADDGARPGALDGVGPHGPPARRRDAAAARRAARRRQEREAPGRESSVRPRGRDRVSRELPAGPPVPHAADRLDGRPRRRDARRRARVVPHLLRRRQRRPGAGRRHRRAHGARQGRAIFRTHRPGPRRHAARRRGSRHAPTVVARRCTTRSRSRAGSVTGTRRPTARATPNTWASSAKSWAAARPRVCTSVSCTASGWPTAPARASPPLEIAGLFTLSADVKQGVPVARVEAAMLEELQRFIEHGPTQAELERREDRDSRGLHPRPRAHRRLRRQGGRARLVRGLCGRSGVLSPVAGVDRSRASRRTCSASRASGSRRATTRSKCCRSRRTPRLRPTSSTASKARRSRPTFPGHRFPRTAAQRNSATACR